MLLSKVEITKTSRKATQVWGESKDYLSEIDPRFGDGDHSVTIGKTAGLTERSLDGWDDNDTETFLEDLGDNTMEIGGGSVGPLYGTMIGGLSGPLGGNGPIGAGTLGEVLTERLSAMEDTINTGVGDKTMVDALTPAARATQNAEDDAVAVLEATREAAAKGVKESGQYVSKYGRARGCKEKTTGTPDAGVVSTSLFFAGFCNGLRQTAYGGRRHTNAINKIKWKR